jgi:hypothetical protein
MYTKDHSMLEMFCGLRLSILLRASRASRLGMACRRADRCLYCRHMADAVRAGDCDRLTGRGGRVSMMLGVHFWC